MSRWLFGSAADRERLLDMEARLRPVRRKTFAMLALGLVICAPWAGWWTLLPMLAAVLVYWLTERLVGRFKQPAILFFAAWVCVEAIIATSVALSGDLRETSVCLLAVPIMTLNARFSGRGIVLGGALAVAAIAAVLVVGNPQAVVREPPILVAPAMLVVAWAMLSTPLMRSDIEHRHGTRIDTLTGMLNRAALIPRVEELRSQSIVAQGAIGAVLCDIDLFKLVNDLLGHQAGDIVLQEVAYTLRKFIRAFESAFRLGGEEFLILLPGADLARTAAVAETLRAAIEDRFRDSQRPITASFGVAASKHGEVFEFEAVLARADTGLYLAKNSGRNRVCIADAETPASAGPATTRYQLDAVAIEAA